MINLMNFLEDIYMGKLISIDTPVAFMILLKPEGVR